MFTLQTKSGCVHAVESRQFDWDHDRPEHPYAARGNALCHRNLKGTGQNMFVQPHHVVTCKRCRWWLLHRINALHQIAGLPAVANDNCNPL